MQNSDINVLIVEDDDDIRDLITIHLTRQGFSVTATGSGEEGASLLSKKAFHLLVLDWMLPGISGLDLVQRMRSEVETPQPAILMVTAKAEPTDIVAGLEQGADDYLTKPFEPSVLIARCKALLRRVAHPAPTIDQDSIEMGNLSIRPEHFEVKCNGEEIKLTRFEFKLLLALCQNRGKVLTRKRLIEIVQGEHVVVIDRTVDTHVFSLRKKLGECSALIETIRGIGYRTTL